MIVIKEIPDTLTGLSGNSLLASVIRDGGMQVNNGKMSCRVVLSTEDDDRSNDRVIIKGIDTSHHRLNPVALFNHDKNAPIGRFEDKLGKYTVRIRNGNELVGEVFFNQSSAFACDVFRAVESKVFTACSIGFMPTKIEKKHDRGHIYHASSLVEGSILVIGDNQRALVEFVEKTGSRQICKELRAMLTPMIDQRPASVVGGFQAEVTIDGRKYVAADSIPTPEPIAPPPVVDDAARRVFDADVHRECHGWEIVKDEHQGVTHYVVREQKTRLERYRHGKWETVKQWAELNSVPFDPATVGKSWDEAKHDRDHGKFSSTGGASGEPEHHRIAHKAADTILGDFARNGFSPGLPSGFREAYNNLEDKEKKDVVKILHSRKMVPDHIRKKTKPPLAFDLADAVYGMGKAHHDKHVSDPLNRHVPFSESELLKGGEPTAKRFSAPLQLKTYLQRMRIKAMGLPEDDDTLQGAAAPVDDTLPPDPNAPPVDPNADPTAEDLDGMTDQMKPFAQMCHTAHEQLMQIMQGLDAGIADTEHPGAGKMADKVKAAVGKAAAAITAAYSEYQTAHDGQPDIPGAEAPPEFGDEDGDGDEDGIPTDDDADVDDLDGGDEIDDTDDEDEPTSKGKAWARYSVKCFNSYWDYIHAKAFAGDKPAMEAAAAFARRVASDKSSRFRNEARVVAKQLRGGVVTKTVNLTDEERWEKIESALASK